MGWDWLIYAAGYLAAAFVLSALLVRLWPESWVAQTIRHRFALFAILPLLIVYIVTMRVLDLLSVGTAVPRAIFEKLSGRKLYAKDRNYYAYSRSRGRKSKKRSKAAPKPD